MEQPRVLLAMLVTVLAFPALLLVPRGGSDRADAVNTVSQVVADAAQAKVLAKAESSTTSPATGAAPASPQTTAPTTEAAPPTTAWSPPTTQWSPPTTAWSPPTTQWTPPPTTAWSPPTTQWTPPPTTAPPGNSQSGLATWYDHNPSGCASRTAPRGATVRVTAANGASITCVVDDYGPFGDGRIIDLSRQGFAALADLGTGVIAVSVTW